MPLILASASPRRRELMALAGLPFAAVSADIDESVRPGEPPDAYVARLSREKAETAARLLADGSLILALDTTVADGRKVLGKPRDAAEAHAILTRLRGRQHHVFTALTLLDSASGRALTQVARSPVAMRAYTDAEIAAYIASGDPFDKAGAYAIQNRDFHPVERFAHCLANVMGLPLCHAARMLRALGVEPPVDVPAACQQHTGYDCPVYARILAGEE